jgi:acetolactate synthase regulatory subunit
VTQEKVVRVVGYYRDPGFLERIVGAFRKLLMDVNWIQGRKISDDGLYEVYMGVPYTNNFDIAIQNLSKTVDVEKVEVLEDAVIKTYIIKRDGTIVQREQYMAKEYDIVVFKPEFTKVTVRSWGIVVGKDIY